MPDLSPAALDLLDALAGDGAYGFRPEPEEPGVLAVVGRLNGISLRRSSASLAAAAELERGGLAVWQPPSRARRRRLVLTARGWIRLFGALLPDKIVEFPRPYARMPSQAEADTCP